jgi:FAD/FMN-containing dehydrogenase
MIAFDRNETAGECVSAIIRAGLLPVAIEFMDRPCIEACEAFAHAGYPDCEALLIVEVEGSEEEIADQLSRIAGSRGGSSRWRSARRGTPRTRRASGSGGKSAFGAMGQMADYICLDGTIPVSQLGPVLGRIRQLADGYGLRVANVFHAGDGNMHPLILFDANSADGLHKAESLGADILRLCVEMGGCLTASTASASRSATSWPTSSGRGPRGPDAGEGRLRPGLAPEPGEGVPARGERRPEAGGVRTAVEGGSDPRLRLPPGYLRPKKGRSPC